MATVSRAVSAKQFAEINNVSLLTVRRGIADGSIPSYKIGRLRRIPLSFLETLQDSQQPDH